MINYNTNIERVEYLDMGDPKNSWYLNAERFDPNFPLAMTYVTSNFTPLLAFMRNTGLIATCKESDFSIDINDKINGMYSVLNLSVELLRRKKNLSLLFVEGSCPNPFNVYNSISLSLSLNKDKKSDYDSSFYNSFFSVNSIIKKDLPWYCFYIPQVYFMARNWNKIEDLYHGTLLICAELEPEELRYKYYVTQEFDEARFMTSQFIVTKDWDLVKKYLFFMIRNHQYENYYVDYPFLNLNGTEFPREWTFGDDHLDSVVSGGRYQPPYDVRNGNFNIMSRTCFYFYDKKKWIGELDLRKKEIINIT